MAGQELCRLEAIALNQSVSDNRLQVREEVASARAMKSRLVLDGPLFFRPAFNVAFGIANREVRVSLGSFCCRGLFGCSVGRFIANDAYVSLDPRKVDFCPTSLTGMPDIGQLTVYLVNDRIGVTALLDS